MPVISHPQLSPRAPKLKAGDDSPFYANLAESYETQGQLISRDVIFSDVVMLWGDSLPLDVNFRPKISGRLTDPLPPRSQSPLVAG